MGNRNNARGQGKGSGMKNKTLETSLHTRTCCRSTAVCWYLEQLVLGRNFLQSSCPDFYSEGLDILQVKNLGYWIHTGKRWCQETWNWPHDKEPLCDYQWSCDSLTRDTPSHHHWYVYSFFRPTNFFNKGVGGPCNWCWGWSGHQPCRWHQHPVEAWEKSYTCIILPLAKWVHINNRSHDADEATCPLIREWWSKFSQNCLADNLQADTNSSDSHSFYFVRIHRCTLCIYPS